MGESNPSGSPASTASALILSLGAARRQGLRGPGRGALWGAAAQGRGAKAAAMASHVRRLKLYPEPQTGGRRVPSSWEALTLGPAPVRPPTNHQPGAGPQYHVPPPLNRPGKRRVLKEPRLAEGWTVGIWENPSLCPKRRHSEREGGVLRKKWKEGSVEKGLQCAVSHSLPSNDTPTLTGARIIRTHPSHLNRG